MGTSLPAKKTSPYDPEALRDLSLESLRVDRDVRDYLPIINQVLDAIQTQEKPLSEDDCMKLALRVLKVSDAIFDACGILSSWHLPENIQLAMEPYRQGWAVAHSASMKTCVHLLTYAPLTSIAECAHKRIEARVQTRQLLILVSKASTRGSEWRDYVLSLAEQLQQQGEQRS